MTLSDGGIRARLNTGHDNQILIAPHPPDWAIQPTSIDIHLGYDIKVQPVYRQGQPIEGDPVDWVPGRLEDEGAAPTIERGQFWLASTLEEFAVPTDLLMMVDGCSTLARRGLSIHQTAGLIDPGFKGFITLELSVVGNAKIELRPGMKIGQARFEQLDAPVLRPYGTVGLNSHYQDQVGPTPAAM